MKRLIGAVVFVGVLASASPAFAGKETVLPVRAMLGGAYNTETLLMNDGLRAAGLIPTKEPYTEMGYHFTTGDQAVADESVFAVEGENAVIDWVVLEIRARKAGTPVVYSRSALIQADGDVVDVDGVSNIVVPMSGFDYYISLRHRNHLAVMTARPLNLKSGADFTKVPVYGTDGAKDVNGIQVLWPGNANFNSVVSYMGAKNDRDAIGEVVGMENPNNVVAGYSKADVNMDGVVKYTGSMNDRDIVLVTLSGNPQAVRTEQLPKAK